MVPPSVDLKNPAAGARPHRVLPGPLALLPERGVHRVGVRRVDVHVVAAGVLVLVEHLLERPPAVGRSEDAALVVRPVRMAEGGDEHAVGAARIDLDPRDLLRVAEAQVGPRLPCVDRLVEAVAGREIRPVQPLAAAGVHHVRVGRGDRQRADRAGRLVVEHRRPGSPGVGRLPHPAVHGPHVERVRLAAVPGRGHGAARAVGPDAPPLHPCEERGTHGCIPSGQRCEQAREEQHGGKRGAAGEHGRTPREGVVENVGVYGGRRNRTRNGCTSSAEETPGGGAHTHRGAGHLRLPGTVSRRISQRLPPPQRGQSQPKVPAVSIA